jgi:diguanylate cyclase (GGDEF)-like protein
LPAAPKPTPPTKRGGPAGHRGRSTPSRRLVQTIREHDVKGERAIAVAQASGAALLLIVHAVGLPGLPSLQGWGPLCLIALLVSSGVRWRLTIDERLPQAWLDALSVLDVGLVIALIWSYQFDSHIPASAVIRPPAFAILLLIVGVRALRFHPRPIVITGLAAMVGWLLLICVAVIIDGSSAVTTDYRTYLTSFRILPVAEVVRLIALTGIVVVLASAAFSARRLLGRAAHASDYGEALEAARQHLEQSVQAREHAESALAALDVRDAELSEQNRLFNAALAKMSQGLCMFDQDQKLVVCNNRYVEMYGLSQELAKPGTLFRTIIESRIAKGLYVGDNAEAYLDERLASAREAVSNTKLHELSDGRVIAITHEPMEGGGWVATHDDVTRLRSIEAKLSHMSRHDALTDLPNRVQLRERMQQVLSGDAIEGRFLVVLLLEIDRFKEVNDTLGPSIGDTLLQGIAQRLRRRLDGADMVARIGGDEFVVLQVADEPAAAADALVKRVRAVLGTSFDIDDHSVTIGVSVGVAIGPADGKEPDELLKNADLALGRAKVDGFGNSSFFERGMDERMRARHKLEHDMRVALRENQFELYYQPQLSLEGGEIGGFEALMRWNHPERGMILPSEFVPLAEDTGFIVPLGEWALREACVEASSWPKGLRVAVNLSVAQFRSGQVRQSVIAALGGSALPPSRLELEITESVLMQEGRDVTEVLRKLQDIGVGLALDDFGTGFSSLSYLTRMRFDKIKIDKHFIRELRDDPNSSLAVVRLVVALARSLDITTVAEGIETKEQLERVREEGCTEAQGFYIGRPMPASAIPAFLAGRKRKPLRSSRRAS